MNILFKFLWKGVEKVTRASVINEHEEGGLRMVDLECMFKSLRLAWLKRDRTMIELRVSVELEFSLS